MPENNEYNTYEKVVGDNLFSDSGLDEMQKSESYRIGFKMFRAMFFTCLVISMIMVATADTMGNTVLAVMGLILIIVLMGFYTLYAVLTAAKGIMPDKYAKRNANPVFLAVICIMTIAVAFLYLCGYLNAPKAACLLIICVMDIIQCLAARHNFKVLKKQMEEEIPDE